jgi:hypothetical protein
LAFRGGWLKLAYAIPILRFWKMQNHGDCKRLPGGNLTGGSVSIILGPKPKVWVFYTSGPATHPMYQINRGEGQRKEI